MLKTTIEQLKQQIRENCMLLGLHFHSYKTHKGSVITYGLHSSPEKPQHSRDCDTFAISFTGSESETTQGKCGKYLYRVLDVLHEINQRRPEEERVF